MHYLKTYADSIGISHYLCWRMKGMRAEEVESYWPQIWYVTCSPMSPARLLYEHCGSFKPVEQLGYRLFRLLI